MTQTTCQITYGSVRQSLIKRRRCVSSRDLLVLQVPPARLEVLEDAAKGSDISNNAEQDWIMYCGSIYYREREREYREWEKGGPSEETRKGI